jgi:hypothetical protein
VQLYKTSESCISLDSVRKLLDTPSYIVIRAEENHERSGSVTGRPVECRSYAFSLRTRNTTKCYFDVQISEHRKYDSNESFQVSCVILTFCLVRILLLIIVKPKCR